MNRRVRHDGFSLTEVLLAAGILLIGFLLICGTLPVGVHLTAKGTERTIAAVVADEAFAKIQLLGIEPVEGWPLFVESIAGMSGDPNIMHVEYLPVSRRVNGIQIGPDAFDYPSTDIRPDIKKYHWSALLRYNLVDHGQDTFQATVFVSRTTSPGVAYPLFDRNGRVTTPLNVPVVSQSPRPVLVPIDPYNAVNGKTNQIWIPGNPLDEKQRLVTNDSILLDDRTGQIMRVIDRRKLPGNVNDPPVIVLDGPVFDVDAAVDFDGDGNPDQRYAWVVPPAIGGGRNPCVAVYQRMIRFK
jgi:hypothetical protein